MEYNFNFESYVKIPDHFVQIQDNSIHYETNENIKLTRLKIFAIY